MTAVRAPRRPPVARYEDDLAEGCPAPDSPQAGMRSLPVRLARRISAIVGFVATLLGLLFVLFPALQPDEAPHKKGATLSNPTVEQLSFGQYLGRADIDPAGYDASALRRRGIVVEFDFAIEGYKNRPLQLRHGLIDARSGDELDKSRDTTFTPQAWTVTGTWPVWIAQPRRGAARVYVQLQLIAGDSDAAIGRVRTPFFGVRGLRTG